MGYDLLSSTTTTTTSTTAHRPAPGRVPATARLAPKPGRVTASTINPAATLPPEPGPEVFPGDVGPDPFGLHLLSNDAVDQELCPKEAKAPTDNAFLQPATREQLQTRTAERIDGAAQNWRLALLANELDKLLQHESGWDAVWETMFYVATAALVGSVDLAAALGTKLASRENLGALADGIRKAISPTKSLLLFTSKGVRIPTRVAVNTNAEVTSPERADASLLRELRDVPMKWREHLLATFRCDLTDAGLVLLYATVDPIGNLSEAALDAEIKRMLARFEAQVVTGGDAVHAETATLGTVVEALGNVHETQSWAWLTPRSGGDLRLARITRRGPTGAAMPHRFVTWVDDDMRPRALARWRELEPDQPIEIVTLADLQDVTVEAQTWEVDASGVTETAHEPDLAYSTEEARP